MEVNLLEGAQERFPRSFAREGVGQGSAPVVCKTQSPIPLLRERKEASCKRGPLSLWTKFSGILPTVGKGQGKARKSPLPLFAGGRRFSILAGDTTLSIPAKVFPNLCLERARESLARSLYRRSLVPRQSPGRSPLSLKNTLPHCWKEPRTPPHPRSGGNGGGETSQHVVGGGQGHAPNCLKKEVTAFLQGAKYGPLHSFSAKHGGTSCLIFV